MIKTKDWDETIKTMEAKALKVARKLDSLDESSPDYEQTAKNTKMMFESEKLAVECKNAYEDGRVPGWLSKAIGAGISLAFGVAVLVADQKGVMAIGTSAVNLWDKISRKF